MKNRNLFPVLCGACLIAGGIWVIFEGFQNPFVAILIIIGFIELYRFQSEKMDLFGKASYILVGIGTIVVASTTIFPIFSGVSSSGQLGIDFENLTSLILFMGVMIFLIIGYILLAVANLRLQMLPKASNYLLIAGAVLIIIMGDIGRYLLCCGLIWQGVYLMMNGLKVTQLNEAG